MKRHLRDDRGRLTALNIAGAALLCEIFFALFELSNDDQHSGPKYSDYRSSEIYPSSHSSGRGSLQRDGKASGRPSLLADQIAKWRAEGTDEGLKMAQLLEIAETNFEAAIAQIPALFPKESADQHKARIKKLIIAIASVDLNRFWELASFINDPDERINAAQEVMGIWRRKDPDRLVEYSFSTLDGQLKSMTLRSLIMEYADRHRYRDSVKLLEKIVQPLDRRNTIDQLAGQWAIHDRAPAIEWMHSLASKDRETAAERIAKEIARDIPIADIISTAKDEPDEVFRRHLYKQAAENAKHTDAHASLSQLEQIPSEYRDQFQGVVAVALGKSDLNEGTGYLLQIPAGKARTQAVSDMQTYLFTIKPDKGLDWGFSLPQKDQITAVQCVINLWYPHDPEAATRWVDQMQSSITDTAVKDEALMRLAAHLRMFDQTKATELANAITNPENRNRTVQMVKDAQKLIDRQNKRKSHVQ